MPLTSAQARKVQALSYGQGRIDQSLSAIPYTVEVPQYIKDLPRYFAEWVEKSAPWAMIDSFMWDAFIENYEPPNTRG
jgi:hypothetical protein